MAKKILITGASGLIGSRLTELLVQGGTEVVHLGRSQKVGSIPSFVWNIRNGTMDPKALKDVDCIINLAGAGVADKRWTASRKREILESRVQSVELLYRELAKGNHQVRSFVSASAIGYYGIHPGPEWCTETSPPASDFLAGIVNQWEREVDKMGTLGLRVAKLRIGIVLSARGGALKSIAAPVKMGFGAALGDGKQYLSWIHIDDLCAMFIKAAGDERMAGDYNAVGIRPLTNRELTKAIAKVLKKPLWLPPVPGFFLRLALGEMADIVLGGSQVSSEKIRQAGFQFRFPEIDAALRDLFSRS